MVLGAVFRRMISFSKSSVPDLWEIVATTFFPGSSEGVTGGGSALPGHLVQEAKPWRVPPPKLQSLGVHLYTQRLHETRPTGPSKTIGIGPGPNTPDPRIRVPHLNGGSRLRVWVISTTVFFFLGDPKKELLKTSVESICFPWNSIGSIVSDHHGKATPSIVSDGNE